MPTTPTRSRCGPRCETLHAIGAPDPGARTWAVLGPDGRTRRSRRRPTSSSAGWRPRLGSRDWSWSASRPVRSSTERFWKAGPRQQPDWVADARRRDRGCSSRSCAPAMWCWSRHHARPASSGWRSALADERPSSGEEQDVKTVLAAALVSLLCSILCTPLVVQFFRNRGFGQEIRIDGPPTHLVKRGTPTMGGVAIIGSTVVGYFFAHLVTAWQRRARADRLGPAAARADDRPRRASGSSTTSSRSAASAAWACARGPRSAASCWSPSSSRVLALQFRNRHRADAGLDAPVLRPRHRGAARGRSASSSSPTSSSPRPRTP